MKEWMKTLINHKSNILYSEEGEELLQTLYQCGENNRFESIKNIVSFYCQKNMHIEALAIIIRNVQSIKDYHWLWKTLASMEIFKQNVSYTKQLSNFFIFYIKDREQLESFTEALLHSDLAMIYTPKCLFDYLIEIYDADEEKEYSREAMYPIYLESLVKQNHWGRYFEERIQFALSSVTEQEKTINQWSSWKFGKGENPEGNLQEINQLILNQKLDQALEYVKNTLKVLDESSPYVHIVKGIESFIVKKQEERKDEAFLSLWPAAWDLSINVFFDQGKFKDAYYVIKSFKLLANQENAFSEYDEIIQRGFKLPNLKKGNSNYAKAFREEQIFENYKEAVRYFKLALEEEDKEAVIKNLTNLYYKIEDKTSIAGLLEENILHIKDVKWLFFNLSRVYKSLNQHKKRIRLAEQMHARWGGTNQSAIILDEYNIIMTDYYYLSNAVEGFKKLFQVNSKLNKEHLNTFARLTLYVNDLGLSYVQLDKLTEILEKSEKAEQWKLTKKAAENREQNRFQNMEAVLGELKHYSDDSLLYTGNIHLKRLEIQRDSVPEQYGMIIEQLSEYFSRAEGLTDKVTHEIKKDKQNEIKNVSKDADRSEAKNKNVYRMEVTKEVKLKKEEKKYEPLVTNHEEMLTRADLKEEDVRKEKLVVEEETIDATIKKFNLKAREYIIDNKMEDLFNYIDELNRVYIGDQQIEKVTRRIKHLQRVPVRTHERLFSTANRLILGLGDVETAIPYLEEALKIEDKKERTMRVLKTAYNRERHYVKLLSMLKENGHFVEDKEWLDFALIQVYIDLEKYDEALMILKMKVAKTVGTEDMIQHQLKMVKIYLQAKNHEEALHTLDDILRKHEYHEKASMLKITILIEIGLIHEAENLLKHFSIRTPVSRQVKQLMESIELKRGEIKAFEDLLRQEFLEASKDFNLKSIQQLIQKYGEIIVLSNEEVHTSRIGSKLNALQEKFMEEKHYEEALTFFLKMLVHNPNFPLLYKMVGDIYEKMKLVESANTFYYISAFMADKKKNWSIYTSFCLRNGLGLERLLGYMHLYTLDAADSYTQKELNINVMRMMFKQLVDVKSQMVLKEITQFYNKSLEIFHVHSEQKTAQLVIGYVQFLKNQYKEATLLLEDHLDFNEKLQMSYYLLFKGELELAEQQFRKLLSEDYQNFAKHGLELVETIREESPIPQSFFLLTEWLPSSPSKERINDYVETCIKEENAKVGLKYLRWLQRCFQDDLPLRRAVSNLQTSVGRLDETYLEEAYQSKYQTITMGKHPNDYLHDIPELIMFCFEHDMDYRVEKIIDYTQDLRQETIVENSKDNRINILKEDVKRLGTNISMLKKQGSNQGEIFNQSFLPFLNTLKKRHFKETLNFVFDKQHLEFMKNKLVWETIYEFLYKKRILSALVREWFISGFDKEEHSDRLLTYLREWREDLYQIIELGRGFVQEGRITETENLEVFNSVIDKKVYNAYLLKSFEELGSAKTELTIKVGETVIGGQMIAKAMAFYIAKQKEDLPTEVELEIFEYCQRYQPSDYYLLRIGNIYFNQEDYASANRYFKQLTLEDKKYRHQNMKMILASELFDRIDNRDKYVGKPLNISSYTFLELSTFVTYILKNRYVEHRAEELFAYLEETNQTLLIRLFDFNRKRINHQWVEAFKVVTTFVDQSKEFYQSILSYFLRKLYKHQAQEDLKSMVESELNRIMWSKKEQFTSQTFDHSFNIESSDEQNIEEKLIVEESHEKEQVLDSEANYLEELDDDDPVEVIIDEQEEATEKVAVDENQMLTNEEPSYNSITQFAHYIPQIWQDFSRYTLDDRREWNEKLVHSLQNEVKSSASEEIRAQTWLKIAKISYELGNEEDLTNALFHYGIHEMKNALNLDIRFVRLYAYETFFIERFRKQQKVNDENIIKSIMSILLDALSRVKKVDELLAEAQNLRWIADNVDLGPYKLGMQSGLDRINSLIRTLEKFMNSNEIDEKVSLYHNIVLKNTDLTKNIYFKDSTVRRLFHNISKHWGRVIKTLNDSLYARPKMNIKVLNDTCRTNGELFLEVINMGEGIAENVQIKLQEFEEGVELGANEHIISTIYPKKTKPVTLNLQFKQEGEIELIFTVSFVDVRQKSSQFEEKFIIKVQNTDKPFEDIPDRYQESVVKNTEDFFGREDIIQLIHKSVSGGDYDKVVIIHGLRRVGKTSILYYLNSTMSEGLIPVFIDMQELGEIHSTAELIYYQFVDAIHHTLKNREKIKLEMPDFEDFQVATMKKFYRYLDSLEGYLNGRKIVFMIDEFEELINAVNGQRVDQSIFSSFRHMMQHRNDCRFIIVGADKVIDMITDYASAIFSISLNIPVKFLEHSAARQMIVEMTPEVRYTDTSLVRLLELTNGHPYYTKILCSNIIQQLNRQKRTIVYLNDVDNATNNVVTMTHGDYFKFLWDMFDNVEKLVVSYIAEKLKHTEERIRLEKIIQPFESNRNIDSGKILLSLDNLVNRNILNVVSISEDDNNSTEYYFSLDLYREWFKYNKPLVKTGIEVKEYVNF
ncbi:hypothetical protein [Priestia megaterium]|uniref:hypothetical protein n=1 Tax=Priestia megaterium TaxID=1404 RepID=UPI0011A111BD|nr:hypothetical protein [Priestia megaterium]